MGLGNWLDRNGTKLILTLFAAVMAGFFAMVSLLITELGQENRASIAQIREDMRQMRTEMREEMRANTLQLTEEILRINDVVDRVETKVDELAGLFKYHPGFRRTGPPSEPAEP